MESEIINIFQEGKKFMEDAIDHLHNELRKIRAGKANTAMFDGLFVEAYGSPMPIKQVANIATADSRTILIQPWDKSMLSNVEQAIFAANLGITPMNDGEVIRITIPPLTQDRRKDLVKQAKKVGEEAKVSLRRARHKMLDVIKKAVKDGLSEDIGKDRDSEVEQMIKSFSTKVDDLITAKEKDILTV